MRGVHGPVIPPAPTTGDSDHVDTARGEFVQLDLEAGFLKPGGDEPADFRLAGASRHKIRVGRVDGNQCGSQFCQLVPGDRHAVGSSVP